MHVHIINISYSLFIYMTAQCPICDALVALQSNVEVSEVVNCIDCGSRVVVESIASSRVMLAQAPNIEEDWGE